MPTGRTSAALSQCESKTDSAHENRMASAQDQEPRPDSPMPSVCLICTVNICIVDDAGNRVLAPA